MCIRDRANVITRAVGSADELLVDEAVYPLQTGDMFLLCSDGLNKTVSDDEITHLLTQSNHNCQEAGKALIQLERMRDANDNVTTVDVNYAAANPDAVTLDAKTPSEPIPTDWYLQ